MHRRDRKLLGVGQTRLDPGDQFPDTLGEQLAVARALSHGGEAIVVSTACDIQAVTRQPGVCSLTSTHSLLKEDSHDSRPQSCQDAAK